MKITRESLHKLFLLLVAGLLYANYIFSNDILSVLATAITCFYLMTCNRRHLLPSILFFTQYALLYRYEQYQITIFILFVFFARAAVTADRRFWMLLFVGAVYIFTHSLLLLFDSGDQSIGDFFPVFSMMCLAAACVIYRPEDKKECIHHYLLGFYSSSFFGLFIADTRLYKILDQAYVYESEEVTYRFAGLSYDCNFYGIVVILVLFFILFESDFIFSRKRGFGWYAMLVLTAGLGLLTYSKTFVLALIILIGCAVFVSSRETKHKFIRMIPLLPVLLFVFRDEIGGLFNIISSRFVGAADLDVLTTGRFSMWNQYVKDVFDSFSSFFFGYGIFGPEEYAAHNLYLEVLSKFGFIGFVADIWYISFSYGKVKEKIQQDLPHKRVVIASIFLFIMFALSTYTFGGFWPIIFFVLISGQEEQKNAAQQRRGYDYRDHSRPIELLR